MNALRNCLSSWSPFDTKHSPTPSLSQPSNKQDNVLLWIHHPEGRRGPVKQHPSDQNLCRHELHIEASIYQNLPVELWLDIVQHAITPPFALDAECIPQNIQFFYTALLHHSFSNPSLKACRKTRANLRLVCRAWKTVVDRVQLQETSETSYLHDSSAKPAKYGNSDNSGRVWIRTFASDQAARYGPCTRFDFRLTMLSGLRFLKEEYKHDVRVIRLQIEHLDIGDLDIGVSSDSDSASETRSASELGTGDRTQNSPLNLTRLLARPWTLQALHISIIMSVDRVPIQLLQGLPLLRTLSVSSNGSLNFTGPFTLPSLTTFFITFGDRFNAKLDKATLDITDWYFPNLSTLSINMKGWVRYHEISEISEALDMSTSALSTPTTTEYNKMDYIAFNDFVRKHKETLRSLSMIPFSTEYSRASEPPLELPLLEALTTDFVLFKKGKGVSSSSHSRIGRFSLPSIKHLVHVSTQTCTQEKFATNMLQVLRSLPPASIRGITVVEQPYLIRRTPYIEDQKGLKELQVLDKYCQDNRIRIYGDMGFEICCIQAAWTKMIQNCQ